MSTVKQYNLKVGKEYVLRITVAADGSPRPVIGVPRALAGKYGAEDSIRWCYLIPGAKRVGVHTGPKCDNWGRGKKVNK